MKFVVTIVFWFVLKLVIWKHYYQYQGRLELLMDGIGRYLYRGFKEDESWGNQEVIEVIGDVQMASVRST